MDEIEGLLDGGTTCTNAEIVGGKTLVMQGAARRCVCLHDRFQQRGELKIRAPPQAGLV